MTEKAVAKARERAASKEKENFKLIRQSRAYHVIVSPGWFYKISGIGRIVLETCPFCPKKCTLEINVSSGKGDGEWRCSHCQASGSTLEDLRDRKAFVPTNNFATWDDPKRRTRKPAKKPATRRTRTIPAIHGPVVHIDPATMKPITPTPAEQHAKAQLAHWEDNLIEAEKKGTL